MLKQGDEIHLENLLRETEAFTESEIRVANELIEIALRSPEQKDYRFILSESSDGPPGPSCPAIGGNTSTPSLRGIIRPRFPGLRTAESVDGYACFGPAPLAEGVHDIYWMAVHPRSQRRGVGSVLMEAVELEIRAAAGRMILIETASKPSYESARAFYARHGYQELARVPDYFQIGDDKIILSKRLQGFEVTSRK